MKIITVIFKCLDQDVGQVVGVGEFGGDEHLEHRSEIASEEEAAQGHRSVGEQADAYVPLPRAPGQEDWVDVILTEAGIIRGMQLPAGITVTVSPEDGEHIVEKFKGKILTPHRSADDPPI